MNKVDLSEFDEAISPSGQRLRMDAVLKDLDDEKEEKLRAALADVKYSGSTIVRALKKWGVEVSEGAVQSWRRKYVR